MTDPGRPRRRRPAHPDLAPAEATPLSSSLDAVLRERGLGGTRYFVTLVRAWSEVVGAPAAAHCRPERLEGDVLVVLVDHPAWATELAFLAPAVVERASELLGQGVVGSLKVRVRGSLGVD